MGRRGAVTNAAARVQRYDSTAPILTAPCTTPPTGATRPRNLEENRGETDADSLNEQIDDVVKRLRHNVRHERGDTMNPGAMDNGADDGIARLTVETKNLTAFRVATAATGT